jgi:hypothetical protein
MGMRKKKPEKNTGNFGKDRAYKKADNTAVKKV